MNRIIKFRAWDKRGRKMVYSHSVWSGAEAWWCPVMFDEMEEITHSHHMNLMQFTGLHDKNGKEIYEGDVVLWRADFFEKVFPVKWSDKKSGFSIKPKYISEMTIVGNIYENPELLK